MPTSPRTTLDRLNGQHIAMLTADHDSALIRHDDGDLEVVAPFDAQAQRDSDQVGASVLRYPAAPWAEDLLGQARAELLAAGKPAPAGTARKAAADLVRAELAEELEQLDAALAVALPPRVPAPRSEATPAPSPSPWLDLQPWTPADLATWEELMEDLRCRAELEAACDALLARLTQTA